MAGEEVLVRDILSEVFDIARQTQERIPSGDIVYAVSHRRGPDAEGWFVQGLITSRIEDAMHDLGHIDAGKMWGAGEFAQWYWEWEKSQPRKTILDVISTAWALAKTGAAKEKQRQERSQS